MNFRLILCALFMQSIFANEGKIAYETYCAACHAVDGKGNPEAGIPPLERSEWLLGNPRRSINVILHGIHGPLEVGGKAYNSMMPGQGAMLNDKQIADIVNYIRVNFKNTEKYVVKPQMVADERKRFASQVMPWETVELLKIYPLVSQKFQIDLNEVVVSYNGGEETLYQGKEISKDRLDIEFQKDLEKGYRTITYRGEALAAINGNYWFHLISDYGVRLKVNDQLVIDRPDGSPIDKARDEIRLKKGVYPFECTIYEREGNSLLRLKWGASGSNRTYSLAKETKGPAWATIELKAQEEILLYRQYIEGMHSSRSIGVAFPTGVNFAFDAQTMAPGLFWNGKFINAGRHWTARGGGLEAPMEKKVISTKHDEVWGAEEEVDLDFKGYQLSPDHRQIVFFYEVDGDPVEDLFKSEKAGELIRITTLKSGKSRKMISYEGLGERDGKSLVLGEKATMKHSSSVIYQSVGDKKQAKVTLKSGNPLTTNITFQ